MVCELNLREAMVTSKTLTRARPYDEKLHWWGFTTDAREIYVHIDVNLDWWGWLAAARPSIVEKESGGESRGHLPFKPHHSAYIVWHCMTNSWFETTVNESLQNDDYKQINNYFMLKPKAYSYTSSAKYVGNKYATIIQLRSNFIANRRFMGWTIVMESGDLKLSFWWKHACSLILRPQTLIIA